jgi:hypothetical protein
MVSSRWGDLRRLDGRGRASCGPMFNMVSHHPRVGNGARVMHTPSLAFESAYVRVTEGEDKVLLGKCVSRDHVSTIKLTT